MQLEAPPDVGRNPFMFRFVRHCRFVRYRLTPSGDSSRLRISRIKTYIRPSAKDN
jgi:hypothetical protein